MTMPTITEIGNEISEVPFGDMLKSVAEGIAQGQQALDLASVQTLIELSQTMVELIPEVTEVITPQPIAVDVPGQPPIQVTGARVTATPSPAVTMSALQAGISPQFYQFTETTIVLKMSVQMREVQETDTNGTSQSVFRAFGSHVNFRTSNTFSYGADASSSVTAVLRPVPPPSRITPATVTVNALVKPPTVAVNP
jgi:hypothetical protein